jgi:hypothetical protein
MQARAQGIIGPDLDNTSGVRPDSDHRLMRAGLVGLAIASVAFIAMFDLRTDIALHDEFMYRWTVANLMAGHGLKLWPQLLPLSLVQIAIDASLWFAHLDPRWLRLTVLPFVVLTVVALRGSARRLGASDLWALVGACAISCSPLFLSVATGQISDVYYIGLFSTALFLGLRWLQTGRGLVALVVVSGLASLQRQHGFGIALALTLVVVLHPSLRRIPKRRVAALIVLTAAAVILVAPFTLGLYATKAGGLISGAVAHPPIGNIAGFFIELGPLMGLVLLPFAAALMRRPSPGAERGRGLDLIPFAIACAGLFGSAGLVVLFGYSIFPGDILGSEGLGPLHNLGGHKVSAFPALLFAALEAVAMVASIILLVRRRRDWPLMGSTPEGAFLLLAAATQALPMYFSHIGDRYFLAVLVPIAPLLAALASRQWQYRPRMSGGESATAAAACLLVVAGVVIFLLGEDDYINWQVARHRVADSAYQGVPVNSVDAGYEEVMTRYVLPYYDRHHAFPPGTGGEDMTLIAPRRVLIFAAAGDPRPGLNYGTLARGKIVVIEHP